LKCFLSLKISFNLLQSGKKISFLRNFLLIFFILSTILFTAYAQKVIPENSNVKVQDNQTSDSLQKAFYIPEDMIFIPADLLYNHFWNNDLLKVQFENLPNKKDTTVLTFNNPAENNFTYPFKGKLLSPFGYRGSHLHTGLDIKLYTGDPVQCAFDGKVRLAKYYHGYGYTVVVRHYNGLETLYAHLSKINVQVNQDIKSGEVIGLGGSTGRATTSHLHFETRFLTQPFNPEIILDPYNYCLKSDKLIIDKSTFLVNHSNHSNSNALNDSLIAENPIDPAVNKHKKTTNVYHTIQKGDTLYSLAKKNGTTVEDICALNKITVSTTLSLGRRLRIR
jgi:murein DD-endopeptidase MepM/ murein hydrolase activator NlpD